jgi:hypothetical protein
LYEFAEWYEQHQEEFSQPQRVALDTIVQTRNMIGVGCKCTRNTRERIAREYFRDFWINNSKTDMMGVLLKATKAKKVTFTNVLSYPE